METFFFNENRYPHKWQPWFYDFIHVCMLILMLIWQLQPVAKEQLQNMSMLSIPLPPPPFIKSC